MELIVYYYYIGQVTNKQMRTEEKTRRKRILIGPWGRLSNQLTSEIPGAYQGPELAMSEWCRNTTHSIEKPTIWQL
jgi:hypothetical protein